MTGIMWRYLILLMAFGAAQLPLQAAEAPQQGRMVYLKTAYHTTFQAYMAGPEDAPYGVLLVHDRWGFNSQVIRWADKLAALGYRVVAIDFFDGRVVRNRTMAREVIKSIDPVWIEANLRAALAVLARPGRKIAGVAWGQGAHHLAGLLRQERGAVAALVTYHQRSTAARDTSRRLNLPLLEVVSDHSLLDPRESDERARIQEETWTATVKFLDTSFKRVDKQALLLRY